MKTKEEVVREFWEQDSQFKALLIKYKGNDEALGEADFLYQQGVRVSDIELVLENLSVNNIKENI
ncbi:MAG: hypothetical protein WCO52_04245 [bacterium]